MRTLPQFFKNSFYYTLVFLACYSGRAVAQSCSGTPTGGATAVTSAAVCSSGTATLSLTGATSGSAIAYQWQSSLNNASWSAISGATTATYVVSPSSGAFYRCVVTCTTSGLSANSTAKAVGYEGSCVCTPTYVYGANSRAMNKFRLIGVSDSIVDNITPSTSGYFDRTSAVAYTTMARGGTYSGNVYYNVSDIYYEDQVWIDFNDNGTFETSEAVSGVIGASGCTTSLSYESYSITIPLGITTGIHRLRVRCAWSSTTCYNSTAMNPCGQSDASKTYNYGSTADYLVNITDPTSCSGTPAAGTAVANTTTACNSTSIGLSLTGVSTSGITYQWQQSTDNVTWSNIGGGTTEIYYATETASTYYRCNVTCTASGVTAASASVLVPFTSGCYCTPTYYQYVTYSVSAASYSANKIYINGYSGSNLRDAFSPAVAGYLDRTVTAAAINLAAGGSYTGTVTYVNTNGYYENQIWIDFDNDGTFAASEAITPVFGSGSCSVTTNSDTLRINVPASAPPGLHRMRVRNAWSNTTCYASTAMSPCGLSDASKTYIYGSTTDYTVNVVSPATCSGAPAGGTATTSTSTACSGATGNITLLGASASGVTYQWQYSSDNATWSNITGATTAIYSNTESASTYYRCNVTCTSSSITSASASVYVPYTASCYCTPTYYQYATYGAAAYGNSMNKVVFNGYSGSNLNDPFAPASAGYVDRTLAISPINLAQGGSYAGTVAYVNTLGNYENQVWIDFNDDGTFAASEAITPVFGLGSCSVSVNQDTCRLIIPLSAPLGYHRMRVRNAWSNTTCYSSTAMNPCGLSDASKTYIYGSTVDYLVNVVAPPVCSGTPAGGTATTTTATACSGSPITLNLVGTSGSGVTFQWQNSPDSTTWTNISGATASAYTATVSATNYYHCVVTCTTSGISAASGAVYIPFTSTCYCTPTYYMNTTYGSASYGNAMNKVVFNGYAGSNFNDAFAPASAGYVDRTLALSPVNLAQGGTYSGTLSYVNTSSYYENQIWIDFDNDGTFAASEALTNVFGVGNCTATTNQDSFSIAISLSAPLGYHRMRVRNAWANTTCYNSTAMNPCGQSDASKTYYYGATVDYLVKIVAPPACSGTPTAGTATTTTATACAGTPVGVTLSGSSASGMSYQWQSSADSATWTNISGATTPSYTGTVSATAYYHCVLTCSASGLSATSQAAYVPYTSTCYCTPTYYMYTTYSSAAYGNAMNKVVFNGYAGSNFNDAFAPASAGYVDRTLALSPVNLAQGGTYAGTLSYVNTSGYYENQVWIDFNDDGTFAASEALTPVFGVGNCTSTTSQDSFSISISLSAPLGYHRMRVRNAWSNTTCYNSTAMNPCGQSDASKTYNYGATVDYLVKIVAPPACSGTPAAGNATSLVATACSGTPVTINLSGASSSGIAYQWQSSADSITWSNISGATASNYTGAASATAFYHCILTCSVGGRSATSQAAYVPYTATCYCTPTYYMYTTYSAAAYGNAMNKVVFNGYAGSNFNDAFAPASAGYVDRTLALSPVNLAQGGTYAGTLSYVNTSSYYENQVWIDFNDDGTFAASEALTPVFGVGNCTSTTNQDSFSINISISAPLGYHRMRVRNAWSNTTCYNSTAMNPCGQSDASKTYNYGATVDYLIKIVAPPACSGTPAAGTATSSVATSCSGTAVTLSLTGSSSSGIAYQWQSSSDSVTWTNIAGATTATYTTTPSTTLYYHAQLRCTVSGITSTSQAVYVPYTAGCYCTPTYYMYVTYSSGAYSNSMNKVIMNGFAGSSINDPFAPSAAGYLDRSAIIGPVYMAQGATYTGTVYYVNTSSYYENQIWIDYNDDGTFAASEALTPVFGNGNCTSTVNQDSFSYSISLSAPAGLHKMRVRNAWSNTNCYNSTAMSPCGQSDASKTYNYGATVDYLVDIVPPNACSGTPAGGTAVSGIGSACSGATLNLSLTGTSASGINYQWQSSTDNLVWSNISGATVAAYSTGETASTYYRCFQTCSYGGGTAASVSVYVPYSSTCYCTPGYTNYLSYGTSAGNAAMVRFSVRGYSGSVINDAFAPSAAGYLDRYTVPTINFMVGNTYADTVFYNSAGSHYENQIWIDFNDDGTFASSEAVTSVFGLGNCTTNLSQDTSTIRIPSGATLGIHRMRVRNAYDNTCPNSTAMNPCSTSDATRYYSYGSTNDYLVNIVPVNCSGTPAAGTTAASVSSGCLPYSTVLSLSGTIPLGGLSYQWYSSPDNVTFTSISGATGVNYGATNSAGSVYYHCVSTCSYSSTSSTSTGVHVNGNALPTVVITPGATSVCHGASTSLAASGAATYSWSPAGTLSSGTATGVTATPTVTVTYTLTGTDSHGCVNRATQAITVNAVPVPTVTAVASTICNGSATNITASGAVTYSWAPAAGLSATTGATVACTAGTSTTYTVTGTNASGCTASASAAIAVNPLPAMTVTPVAAAICNGSSTGITASGAATYSWSPATGLTTTTGASVTCNTSATRTYTITGTSAAGCVATTTETITVNAVPVLTITPVSPNICIGNATSISATGAGTYSWSPSTGLSAATGSTVTCSTNATRTYTVTGTSAAGCTATANQTITVNAIPVVAPITGLSSVCQGASITLSDTTSGGTWGVTNSNAAVTGGVVTGTVTGHDTVTYTKTVSGCPATTSHAISVLALPNSGTITGGISSLCMGSNHTLSDAVGGGTWITSNPGIASVNSGLVTTVAPGVVQISYSVTNGCGTALTTDTITVKAMQWVGGTSGNETNWTTAANWACGTVPVVTDDVIIPGGPTYAPAIATSATAYTRNITIDSGATITINGTGVLNVKGALSTYGVVLGNGTLSTNGTSTQLISGYGRIENLNINNSTGVTIVSGASLTVHNTLSVTQGTLTTNDSLILASDSNTTARIASLPLSGAAISGNVKVMQYIEGGYRRYRFWSHPFSTSIALSQIENYIDITGQGGSLNGFTNSNTNSPSAFWYSPMSANSSIAYDPGWKAFTSAYGTVDSNRIHAQQGIRLFVRGIKGEGLNGNPYTPSPVTIGMWGPVNQGNLVVHMQKGSAANQDYNQLGNPYPSPVDIGTIIYNAKTAGNITGGGFFVWNAQIGAAGQYQMIPIGTSSASPYYLQSCSAFQVRAAHNGDTLNFAESNKASSPSADLMKTLPEYVSLTVYDANYHPWDMFYMRLTNDAADGEDNNDAVKPSGADFNLYSLSANGAKLALDARPYASGKVIPMGITSAYAQDFIIKAEGMAIPAGGKLYLHDKLLKQYVLLQEGTEYRFTISADKNTQGDNRFELQLGQEEGMAQNAIPKVTMTPNPATDEVKINFANTNAESTGVRVLDLTGTCVFTQDLGKVVTGTITVPLDKLSAGLYVVELTMGQQMVKEKLVKE